MIFDYIVSFILLSGMFTTLCFLWIVLFDYIADSDIWIKKKDRDE